MISNTEEDTSRKKTPVEYFQTSILNSVEDTTRKKTPIILDRVYYERKLLSVINKGLAYLRAHVQPDPLSRLNGQNVDSAILRRFELRKLYNEEVIRLLIATSGHRDDWACVLPDVETRRLTRSIKNVIYLAYRGKWLLVHVDLQTRTLYHYTSSAQHLENHQTFVAELRRLFL